MAFKIEDAPFEVNIADKLSDDVLARIGMDLKEQIEIDEESRMEWMDTNRGWLKLASQVRENKNFPWPGASNVKFPLLTIAAMQFQARALPNLINSNQPIRVRVIGKDPMQEKLKRANRVSKFMSYQILEGMEDWMEEMDRMLFVLPMVGITFKKTYISDQDNKIKSKMILPNDLIINYYAQNFERARMTEVMYLDDNQIRELQAQGIFLDIELTEDQMPDFNRSARDEIMGIHASSESDMEPWQIWESHCFLDLDGDGYKEPYIVTLTREGQVLRIVARWSEDAVYYNNRNKVAKIVSDQYYTAYTFLPDPTSSVSGIGLGSLLGPVNESVNTIINQLIDAGTLATLQGGFLGRGVKLRGGATRFRPGEWKIVNANGDDIRKSVFPMPVKEPSTVLFQLLGLLVDYGERVSAVSETMMGQNPGQNQPASTTMAVLEQGFQVFTSVNKRLHRSLSKEYKKLYKLNSLYLDEDMYNMVLDENLETPDAWYTEEDFTMDDMDIKPASDPTVVSQAQKSVKSEALMQKLAVGLPLNVQEVTKRILESEDQEDIPALMDVQPRPDPEVELKQAEFEHKVEMDFLEKQLDALKIRAQALKDETGADLNVAKAEDLGFKAGHSYRQQNIDAIQNEAKLIIENKKVNKPSDKGKNETN